ncbi:MAG: type II secretion system protein GspL [Ectothiorhodospiraceae bacterium]|nr:type II secretion system protein GspL [Ectothiorhodospiraceae bacterium]
MRPRLILRLQSDGAAALPWALLDRDGHVQEQGVSDDLASLADYAGDRPVTALVSGADVLLTSALVPTQSRQKLLRAIPYALEDMVSGDVDDMHFVLGDKDANNRWAVAVVNIDWLEDWLERLSAAGLSPERLLPEPLCLPLELESWTVLVEPSRFLVRTGPQQGFGGDRENLELLLEMALEEQSEWRPQRVVAHVRDGAGLPDSVAGVDVENRPLDSAEALLCAGLDDSRQIQLLAGAYAPKQTGGNLWRPWIPALILFALWVSLDTGRALLDQRQLQAEIRDLETTNLETFRQIFPEASSLQAARTRVENRLNQTRSGPRQGGDALLDTLEAIGPILQAGEGFRLTGLSYRNGNLELELTASDLQRLDRLQQELDAPEQLQAEVRSARSEDDAVQGRLLVRRGP